MAAQIYSMLHQFEPLFPEKELDPLRARAAAVVDQSLRLSGKVHPATAARLRELLRAMNSYYSNHIEGQSTHPRNIERALKKDFAGQADIATLQRIALAHMDAEQELEQPVSQGERPLTKAFALRAHAAMYARLSAPDRSTKKGSVVAPGAMRSEQVDVGRHVPPVPESVPRFLERYEEAYVAKRAWDEEIIKIACAHQRLTWIHPFADGNGRAARLVTHAALFPVTRGLWSVCRGLARRRDEYYARLEDADEPRRGDLDGRGNLSEEGLRRWCAFFLDVCDDQVSFMARMLDLDEMKTRIRALIEFRAASDKALRADAVVPLHYLFAAGPLARGEFKQLTGLGDRTAQALLSRLLATGVVESDSSLGPVSFGMPLDALQFLFPDLYPEVATGQD